MENISLPITIFREAAPHVFGNLIYNSNHKGTEVSGIFKKIKVLFSINYESGYATSISQINGSTINEITTALHKRGKHASQA